MARKQATVFLERLWFRVRPQLRSGEPNSLLSLEPPEHTHLRKRVNGAFVSHRISKLEPRIREKANAAIDQFAQNPRTELLQHYATPIPLAVITELLGVPASAAEKLVAWSHAIVKVYTLTQSFEDELAANRAAAEFHTFMSSLIEHKKLCPGNDLISHLLASSESDQPLTEAQIISVCVLLLNAGHEASVHQLGNAIYTLLTYYYGDRRKELLDALANNATADSLVDECLRYCAPLHLFTRYAQQTLSLEEGLTIERGDTVGLLLAAANRCPLRFDNPGCFDPARSDGGFLSFGAGIHYCVGAQLAKLEMRIALQVLFERLPDLSLAATPNYQNAYHFHGLEALYVNTGV